MNTETKGDKDEVIRFRVSSTDKDILQAAAEAEGVSLTAFLCGPALERGRALLADLSLEQTTVMPRASFDVLMASLDEPGDVNERLIAAGRRLADDQSWDLD